MKLILSIVLISFIHQVYTNDICPNPGETCMHYKECPQDIQDLLKLRPKPIELLQRLKNARCGETKSQKLCCKTPECYTWDGRPGVCVDFSTRDKSMSKRQNKISRCSKKQGRFVCHSNLPVKQSGQCDSEISAFPPDPSLGCCGKDNMSQYKILGGISTKLDQFPWLVVIKYRGDIKNCSGALISGKYVLTAAHCVDYSSPQPYAVVLGEHDKSSINDCDVLVCRENVELTIKIEEIKVHEDFDPTSSSGRNDIALIRLEEMARYSDFIQPICLPTGTTDITAHPPADFRLWSAGWGSVNDYYPSSSDIKGDVQLPFVNPRECLNSIRSLWSLQMCAGGEANKNSCIGDSGSPLMFDSLGIFEVLGIKSHGVDMCGISGVPVVYTKVYSYSSWIHRNIRP